MLSSRIKRRGPGKGLWPQYKASQECSRTEPRPRDDKDMPRPTSEQRRLSQGWTLMEFRKKEQGERTQKKPPTRAQHEMMIDTKGQKADICC